MKLFCAVFIGLFLLSACSSDDDSNPNSNTNSIIGIWKAIKEINVCSTGSEETYDLSECEQNGRTTFSDNGVFSITEFDLINGNCEEEYNDTGTWSLNEGVLTVTISDETNSPTFFELSNNILRIGNYEDSPNLTCNDGSLLSHYYTEFIRVQ